MAKTNPPAECPKTWDEVHALSERAQKGDRAALAALRQVLDRPKMVDVLGGDLADQARLVLIDKLSGQNLVFKETIPRKLDNLRAELEGKEPSPLERLLVDRVVTGWLHLHQLEMRYACKDGMTLTLADHYQRCIDRAQRRYLSAIKVLALVRKLALPVLQVNIARKQVNVAGACPVVGGERDPEG